MKKVNLNHKNEKKKINMNITITTIFILAVIVSIYTSCKYYDTSIIGINDKYKEFIYGDTVFLNYNKSVDITVVIIFILVFLSCYIFFDLVFKPKKICINNKIVNEKTQFMLLIFVPFIIFYLPKLIGGDGIGNYIIQYLIYVFLWYIYFYKNHNKHRTVIKGILIIIFAYMSSIAISYFINRYFKVYINYTIIMVFLTLICFICFNKYGIYLSQIALPIYFIKILENGYYYRNELIHIENSINLKIFVSLLILCLSICSIYEIRKNKDQLFVFSTVIVILFLLIWNNEPLIYVSDEYHFGELFTAFDQIVNKGNMAYRDYIPVKGYFHVIVGYINKLFLSGGYVSLQKANNINVFLSSFLILGFSYLYLSKELMLLFIFLNIIPSAGNYFLVLPSIYLLTRKKIINDEYNFILAYLYITFIVFVYYQSFGIAISLALFPMIMYYIYKIFKNKICPNKKHIIMAFPGIVLFILNFQIIIYGLKYSLINASANLFYWGNDSGYLSMGKYKFFISIIKKNIWALFVVIAVIIFIKKYKKMKSEELLINIFIITFPLSILSYTQGRHDGMLARANAFSITLILLLMFYSIYRYNKEKNNYNLIFLIIMIALYFSYSSPLMISDWKLKTEISHTISDTMITTNGSNIKKIGNGFIEKSILSDLEAEKKLFDSACSGDNDTFLVIDSYVTQSARYSLFDYDIPTLSHSMLNIPSINEQKLELERVENFNIPIIRVSDGINRYYLFHKRFLNGEYVYTTYNGREYLIEKDRFPKLKDEFKLEELRLPDYYSKGDFGVLPIKWGNGYKSNKEKMTKKKVNYDRVSGNNVSEINGWNEVENPVDPFMVYSIDEIAHGSDVDFIKLTLNQKDDKEVQMQIFWNNEKMEFNEENSVRFIARDGDIVVPVGMNLHWRNSQNINTLRFDIDGLDTGGKFNIEKLELINID